MTDSKAIKLPSGRNVTGYHFCSARAVSDGSTAQMMHFVEDAKKDIAYLAALALPLPVQERIERPISSPLQRETDETWKQVIDLFRKHGLSEPPVRLRDELVVALEWAWYGQARAASPTEGQTP